MVYMWENGIRKWRYTEAAPFPKLLSWGHPDFCYLFSVKACLLIGTVFPAWDSEADPLNWAEPTSCRPKVPILQLTSTCCIFSPFLLLRRQHILSRPFCLKCTHLLRSSLEPTVPPRVKEGKICGLVEKFSLMYYLPALWSTLPACWFLGWY